MENTNLVLNKKRIVLTGGPGAGKTTAADLLQREMDHRIAVVPESATMIFSGGFPRKTNDSCLIATQKTIYHVQKNMENVISATYPERILLCDRGTVDGSAYWPRGCDDFFHQIGTTKQEEFLRYDAVIFFESAAVGGVQIEGGNPARIESLEEAAIIDEKLKQVWSDHPHFHLVKHEKSFFRKITKAINLLNKIIHNGVKE